MGEDDEERRQDPEGEQGRRGTRDRQLTANAIAPSTEASPTNPKSTTAASQVSSIGRSSQALIPATAPRSVASPLPPRKPYQTG